MRIGITGGAGFIAGHVFEEIIHRYPYDVMVFDTRGRIERDAVTYTASEED